MECARPLPRLLRRLTLAAVLITSTAITSMAITPTAGAHERRVVVIDVDPPVADALVVALSPWSLSVVRAPGPRPAADLDAATARASAIAVEDHAGAVVWIAPPRTQATQATLWVYDAQTKQLAVRPLTVWAPFDDAGAASVALSVKTILRASPLASVEPPDTASGLPSPSPASGPPQGTARPSPETTPGATPGGPSMPTQPPTSGAVAPASGALASGGPASRVSASGARVPTSGAAMVPTSGAAMVPTSGAAMPLPAPTAETWRVETVLGVRAPTGASTEVEPRAALGVSMWPSRFGDRVGLGLAIQAGPGVSVETPAFQGELREASLDVTARLRTRGGRWFAFECEGGPALYLTSLGGNAIPTETHLHALRLDPALDLGGVADVTPGPRIAVGLLVDGATLLRFQRYSLDGSPLLRGPTVTVLAGLRLSVEVD